MGRGSKKSTEPTEKRTRMEEEDGNDGADVIEMEEGTEGQSQKLEDGLAFWVASKTITFKVNELESFLKKTLLSAGFTVEECSVSEQHVFII